MALELNNANFTSYLCGLDSNGWASFASDATANFAGAFSSRFTLTDRWMNALSGLDPVFQAQVVNGMQYISQALAGGNIVSAIGEATDYNPSGPVQALSWKFTGVDLSLPPDIVFHFELK